MTRSAWHSWTAHGVLASSTIITVACAQIAGLDLDAYTGSSCGPACSKYISEQENCYDLGSTPLFASVDECLSTCTESERSLPPQCLQPFDRFNVCAASADYACASGVVVPADGACGLEGQALDNCTDAAAAGSGGSAGSASSSGGNGGTGGASGSGSGGASAGSGSGGQAPACLCSNGCGTCPTVDMVDIPVYGFSIDATEVTTAHYASFLDAQVPATSPPQSAYCNWNTTYIPAEGWLGQRDDLPVVHVDWCDAAAFCEWAGKHLCGNIGGGEVDESGFLEATQSEWYNACSVAGMHAYSYGDAYSATTCNTESVAPNPKPVGSFLQCHASEAPYSAVYDLVGNVGEWVNSCMTHSTTSGSSDYCRVAGGDWSLGDSSFSRCTGGDPTRTRGATSNAVGFRCCGVVGGAN